MGSVFVVVFNQSMMWEYSFTHVVGVAGSLEQGKAMIEKHWQEKEHKHSAEDYIYSIEVWLGSETEGEVYQCEKVVGKRYHDDSVDELDFELCNDPSIDGLMSGLGGRKSMRVPPPQSLF